MTRNCLRKKVKINNSDAETTTGGFKFINLVIRNIISYQPPFLLLKIMIKITIKIYNMINTYYPMSIEYHVSHFYIRYAYKIWHNLILIE